MRNLIKEIISIFVIIVIVHLILELGEEQKSFFDKQVRFFGVAIIMSIIGGFLVSWWKSNSTEKKKDKKVDD